ncbi:MAG TPA: hypothetical protein PK894_00765 [Defluviitoga sp.]|nr:hypothetical protein [Defluviitoga sp.]HOP24180.1 hypothetical protein [Defluviitoga sp.]HPZ28228.1 hypothetical protein [Defluviitoga sp.]HQD62118.1 hypothetical protein [Defluviitoga sp.]
MKKAKVPLKMFLTIVFVSFFMFTGCEQQGKISIGMAGSKTPFRISYHFTLFSGQKDGTVRVKTEQKIIIEYKVEINDGILYIGIQSPSHEIIWESIFDGDQSETNTVEIDAVEKGTYNIIIKGQEAKGSFDVSWKTE